MQNENIKFKIKKKHLEEITTEITKKIEPILIEVLNRGVASGFRGLIDYQIKTGGKRLRPVLAVLSCRALGGKMADVLYPSAGLEILHNYSLVVDDVIDHSELRRNNPTLWKKHGTSIAQSVAIDYSAAIFQSLADSKYIAQLTEVFAQTMKVLVEGEILDILFERKGRQDEPYIVEKRPKDISMKNYLTMIAKKTAKLLETCCLTGAICAGGSQKQNQCLAGFGLNLGLAFQIQDDILDMFGKEKDFGKQVGKDIEERKGGNIVLLLALNELKIKTNKTIADILQNDILLRADIDKILLLIQETKALEKANKLKQNFIEKAKVNLSALPQNQYTRALSDIADFVIQREK